MDGYRRAEALRKIAQFRLTRFSLTVFRFSRPVFPPVFPRFSHMSHSDPTRPHRALATGTVLGERRIVLCKFDWRK